MSRRGVAGATDGKNIPQPFPAERIQFDGLEPGMTYKILLPDGINSLIATTAPVGVTPPRTSFLAFSCNNPFAPSPAPEPMYSDEEEATSYSYGMEPAKLNSLRTFEARATGNLALRGWPRPSFALGLGDQIYTDGDNGRGARFALFRGDRSTPFFPREDSRQLLELVYRAHLSIPPFHRALQSIPAALIWDDHDVRDGFGSKANTDGQYPEFDSDARAAFQAYQWLRGPIGNAAAPEGTMEMEFSWGDQLHVLLLDTRTSRLEEPTWSQQLMKVQRWLKSHSQRETSEKQAAAGGLPSDGLKPSVFVLGVPSPLTAASHQRWSRKFEERLAGVVEKEAKDDLNEMWVNNPDQLRELLALLQDHFLKNRHQRLLVLSGDLHFSGINYLSTGRGSKIHDKNNVAPDVYEPHRLTCKVHRRQHLDSRWRPESPGGDKNFLKEISHKDEDILWGWEVISSGLTNSAIIDSIKSWALKNGTIDAKMADNYGNKKGDAIVTSWSQGAVFESDSFAELLVDLEDAHSAPKVSVLFYPSRQDKRITNYAQFFHAGASLGAYDFYKGSRECSSCLGACGGGDLTPISLDWNCIPETQTGKKVYSCVQACAITANESGPSLTWKER